MFDKRLNASAHRRTPQLTGIALRTRARVLVQRLQRACATVLARFRIAGVFHGNLAQRGRKAKRTRAMEARCFVLVQHRAVAVVLAARTGAGVARIRELAVFANVA